MGKYYRNKGAPFRRKSDGHLVARGSTVELEEEDYAPRKHKLEELPFPPRTAEAPPPAQPPPVAEQADGGGEEKTEDAGAEEGEEAESPPGWPMKMKPKLYLKMHPKGPHAALARQIVEGG